MACLQKTGISIFSILLLSIMVVSEEFHLDFETFGRCLTPIIYSNQSGLIINNTNFQNSLETLFSNLNSFSGSFYTTNTAGVSPNKVYGLTLCRRDVTSRACRTCINNMFDQSNPVFDNCKEGFVHSDECMVHFANYSFFGTSNDTVSVMSVSTTFLTTNYGEYNATREELLKGVVVDATNNTELFATNESRVLGGAGEKIYALGECTRDLDRDTCNGCLNAAFVRLTNISGGVSISGWVMFPSCQLRYDNVSFYGGSMTTSNPTGVVSVFVVTIWSIFFYF